MYSHDSVLIIGAGITGLSCACHLGGGRILEKESDVGGLCRSYSVEGFTFDFTGHLLHLKDPYTKKLIDKLAPGRFVSHERRAKIYSKERFTSYPFQANLWGLPDEVIEECLEGLREAIEERKIDDEPENFRRWILRTFGRGIARHFMFPYNVKLWRIPLEEMTTEWVAGLIPIPLLEDALRGAREPEGVKMGYNTSFLYPPSRGIAVLPRAFVPHVPRIHLNRAVVAVDAERKRVYCEDGHSYHYEVLVSTMPLPLLVRCLKGVPDPVARAAETLRYVSVYDLNLGVERKNISPDHWIYFPEEAFIFYRVGFPGNFSENMTPPGKSSVYVEVAHLPEERISSEKVVERSLEGLKYCRLIDDKEEILFQDLVKIPYAYVIFDAHRRRALPFILDYLREYDIFSVGRYGGWLYLSMEEAILTGRRVAEQIVERYG